MSLDLTTIRRVAALARLQVEEAELPRLQAELNGILGWIEQLQSLDTSGVESMSGGAPEGQASLPMREDVVSDGGMRERVLANAPAVAAGAFFAVPKVVE